MEFQFAKYTEITDYVFKVNPDYKNNNYVRFFICPDVWDFWFVRILKGFECNEEEGYIENEDNYILERNKIEIGKRTIDLQNDTAKFQEKFLKENPDATSEEIQKAVEEYIAQAKSDWVADGN